MASTTKKIDDLSPLAAGNSGDMALVSRGGVTAKVDLTRVGISKAVAHAQASTGSASFDPTLLPFSSHSPWRLGIAREATFAPDSDARNASINNVAAGVYVNYYQYSHPIAMASTSDPLATVTDSFHPVGGTPTGGTWQEYIPAAARIASGTDRHMHIITPDKQDVIEHFGTVRNDTTHYSCTRRHRVSLRGSGIGPQNGTRAYGGSAIGGLIRVWEMDPANPNYTGRIDHPIAIALRLNQLYYSGEAGLPAFGGIYDENGYGQRLGYVWPASEQDAASNTQYSGPIPMGSYFAIKPDVDLTTLGLSNTGLMVARAMQDYGAYITDASGTAALYLEDADVVPEGNFAGDLLRNNQSDLKILFSNLRVVTSNGPSTPNGGALGVSRRGAAPSTSSTSTVSTSKYKGLLDNSWESATTRSPSYSQGTMGTTIGGNGANAQGATGFPLVNTLAVQIAPAACTKLRVAYGAFFYGTDLPNAVPIQGAAIEYPHNSGNIYPLTFGGATAVNVQPGAVILSDELMIPGGVTAGSQYNVRTSIYFASPQSGQAWPSYDNIKGLDKNLAAGSGSTNAATTPYASFPSGNSAGYGPCAIFGNSGTAAKSVAAIGDSIIQGVYETNTANGVGNGYLHRALAGSTVGIANLGRHAERASDWNTLATKHRQRIAYSCSHAEVNYGINDIRVDSVTLPVLQARAIAVWRDLAAGGLKVRQHTITPNSTSTDSYATTTNQTIANATQNAVRVGFNGWLRAGAPLDPYTFVPTPIGMAGAVVAGQTGHPLVGYREIADAVESARDSGIWAAPSGALTADGLHPNQAGHILMAAVVTPASIT